MLSFFTSSTTLPTLLFLFRTFAKHTAAMASSFFIRLFALALGALELPVDLGHHLVEGPRHVLPRLRRHLDVAQPSRLSELHCLVELHLPRRQVALVPHERHEDLAVAALLCDLEPLVDLLEGLARAEVEDEEGADGSSEEYFGNALELLLAEGVPDVEVGALLGVGYLEDLVVNLHLPAALLVLIESVFDVSVDDGGLADLGGADEDEFELVINSPVIKKIVIVHCVYFIFNYIL